MDTKDDYLHIRVNSKVKARARRYAKTQGKKLSELVNDFLEESGDKTKKASRVSDEPFVMPEILRRKESKPYLVYLHLYNGVPFYVGCGRAARALSTKSRTRAWKNYVKAIPHYDIRIVFKSESESIARKHEEKLIKKYANTLVNAYGVVHPYPSLPKREQDK